MDVIGITNENYWSSSEEKEVKERAILRVLVFGLSMPGDLTRLVGADFFRFPISVYETDEAGTRATVLNKDAFYAYLEEFESSPIRGMASLTWRSQYSKGSSAWSSALSNPYEDFPTMTVCCLVNENSGSTWMS